MKIPYKFFILIGCLESVVLANTYIYHLKIKDQEKTENFQFENKTIKISFKNDGKWCKIKNSQSNYTLCQKITTSFSIENGNIENLTHLYKDNKEDPLFQRLQNLIKKPLKSEVCANNIEILKTKEFQELSKIQIFRNIPIGCPDANSITNLTYSLSDYKIAILNYNTFIKDIPISINFKWNNENLTENKIKEAISFIQKTLENTKIEKIKKENFDKYLISENKETEIISTEKNLKDSLKNDIIIKTTKPFKIIKVKKSDILKENQKSQMFLGLQDSEGPFYCNSQNIAEDNNKTYCILKNKDIKEIQNINATTYRIF